MGRDGLAAGDDVLATTTSTPIWGKLADLFDKLRLVQTALVLFVVASAVAGLSPDMTMLISMRVVQGLGAGGLTTLAQVVMATTIFDWVSWPSAALVGAGVLLLAPTVLAESRAAEPIIPLRFFRNRTIVRSALASLLVGIAMFGGTVFLSQHFQLARAESPTVSGVLTLPMVLGLFVASTVAGRSITRTGRWKGWASWGPSSGTRPTRSSRCSRPSSASPRSPRRPSPCWPRSSRCPSGRPRCAVSRNPPRRRVPPRPRAGRGRRTRSAGPARRGGRHADRLTRPAPATGQPGTSSEANQSA